MVNVLYNDNCYDFSFLFYRCGDNVLYNTTAGQMLKTKAPSSDEGGIAQGASALDTPLLIPEQQYIEYFKSN